MMNVRCATLAQAELAETRKWLNQQQPELGKDLNEEVRQVAARIERMPFLFPLEHADVRKCRLTRAPYIIRFVIRDAAVFVIAFSHQHRDPDSWGESDNQHINFF